jgi:hypothetical protein
VGHFNRPGARFTPKRFYVCDFGATKDAMSGSKMSFRLYGIGFVMWFLDMHQLIGNEESLA